MMTMCAFMRLNDSSAQEILLDVLNLVRRTTFSYMYSNRQTLTYWSRGLEQQHSQYELKTKHFTLPFCKNQIWVIPT